MRASAGCVGLLVGALALSSAGCDDKKAPNVAPAASSLAPATPPPPGSMVMKFTIEESGTADLVLEAPKEKIKAKTTAALGELDVDLMNLTNSRGEVKVDLTTLTTSTFDEKERPGDNAAQTTHARTWLEVADGEKGPLEESVKKANRYAVYAIRAVENVAPGSDLTKVPATKDGADEVRTVTLSTKGELLVHGHKVEREAEIELQALYEPGAAADKPKALVIKSKSPLKVVLAEHDVKPRDGLGKIAKGAFNLLGTKVAENALITLAFRAKPKS